MARRAYVIFGAAVRADGSPSGVLRRRIEGAVAAAKNDKDGLFIASGAAGRHGIVEAEAIAGELARRGVPASRIVLDGAARDTLQSVLNVRRIAGERGDIGEIVVCSSRFHNPRCALLFRLAGLPARVPPMPADRPPMGLLRWAWFCLREIPAIPWDGLLVLWHRWGRRGG